MSFRPHWWQASIVFEAVVAALVVIGGPADRVACVDPKRLALEQLQGLAVAMKADPDREQALGTPALVGEGDLPFAGVNAGYGVAAAR